ncbi:MAG: metallophosphoesterase [Actinomycetota bacterium]
MSQPVPDNVRSAIAVLAALCLLGSAAFAAPTQAKPAPLIAAAGDIACGPNNPRYNGGFGTFNSCQQLATSNLLLGRPYAAILPLGDIVYDDNGSLASYYASYSPTWGRFKRATHPAIGNHEYDDGLGGQGYWDYFNGIGDNEGRAGVRGQGWYAYNVGSWRLIALNSNCDFVACARTSRQIRFLERELEEHPDRCVLAYFHHPRFTSGLYEEIGDTRAIWRALYRGGADVVLNGHDHIYERFAPQRPSGIRDWRTGISQFSVGTGGYFLFPVGVPPQPNSQFTFNGDFGILNMRLGHKRYGWSFVTAGSRTSIDSGRRGCHREPKRRRPKHKG